MNSHNKSDPTPTQSSEAKTALQEATSINEYTKVGDKTDGKNKAKENGVYISNVAPSEKYFVKTPEDPIEFFAELFAGKMITGLREKFIPPDYQDTVIPANEILMNDRTYGLIQPFRQFTPLHTILDNNRGKQKFVLAEILKKARGIGYEGLVNNKVQLKGLSYALFIKFLLADYSVHDGNIGVKDTQTRGTTERSFVAIDFGAALRAISRTNTSQNIYQSLEEPDKFFNFYKKYPEFYANMPDLFRKIKDNANAFKKNITDRESEFYQIIENAITTSFFCFKKNFETDWIAKRDKLLNYMYKDDTDKLAELKTLDDEDLIATLAEDMNQFLLARTDKLAKANAPTPLNRNKIKRYHSISNLADINKTPRKHTIRTTESAVNEPTETAFTPQHTRTTSKLSHSSVFSSSYQATDPNKEKESEHTSSISAPPHVPAKNDEGFLSAKNIAEINAALDNQNKQTKSTWEHLIVDKAKTHADTHTTNNQHFTVHRDKLTTDSNDSETFVIMLKLFAKVNEGKNIYPVINAPSLEIKKLWETAIQEAVKQNIYNQNDISQLTINVKEPTTKPSHNS